MSSKRKKSLNSDEKAEINSWLAKSKKVLAWEKDRIKAVKLFYIDGYNRTEVADFIELDPTQIGRWLDWYSSGGIEGLLAHRGNTGRKGKFSVDIWSYTKNGIRDESWADVNAYVKGLKKDKKLTVPYSTACRWLNQCKE